MKSFSVKLKKLVMMVFKDERIFYLSLVPWEPKWIAEKIRVSDKLKASSSFHKYRMCGNLELSNSREGSFRLIGWSCSIAGVLS